MGHVSGSRIEELDEFKRAIDLREFAMGFGYVLDRRRSSRASAALRHTDGHKLIVSRGPSGHWRYFNVHDERDRGTIIDFLQLRQPTTLGEVRKELRQWLGRTPRVEPQTHDHPVAFTSPLPDLAGVAAAWEKANPINGLHAYLEKEREIPRHILADPIFADVIRSDARQNALFAHYDAVGALCGFEVKNRGFTGFSPGGRKGQFTSAARNEDRELWICETAIDALSAAALFGTVGRRFVSTAGQLSPVQRDLVRAAALAMPPGTAIVLATDNDAAGRNLAASIQAILAEVDLSDRRVVTRHPLRDGEDYNDVLRRERGLSDVFPSLV